MGAAVVVCACTLFAFIPALGNQFVDWDDPDNFLKNEAYRGLSWDNIQWMFSTFHMGHYQPLTWMTLGLDSIMGRVLFGNELDPRPYHFTNVLLHALNAVLVFLMALQLLRRTSIAQSRSAMALILGALVAGLFFGIHPLRVESVAWVTERRDLVSAFFLFLAVMAYLHAQSPAQKHRIRWMAITLLMFLLSLMSKVVGVTLPVVLLIIDWYPLRRLDLSPLKWLQAPSRKVLLEKAPFFALSIVFGLIVTIGQSSNQWLITMNMHPMPARIMQSLYGLEFYVWKTLIPTNLLPLYQMQMPLDYTQAKFFIAGAIVFIAGILVVLLRRRAPWLLAATATYVVILGPVLGLVQNGAQLVADRYSYLACIPWAMLLGAAMSMGWRSSRISLRYFLAGSAAFVMVVLGALTWRQSLVWRSTESLWTYTHFGDPTSTFAKNGYGYVLLQRGDYPQAVQLFREVLAIAPDNDKARANLWNALEKMDDDAALSQALREATLVPRAAVQAHYRLGNRLLANKQFAEAADEYRAALQGKPDYAQALTNLGIALQALGNSEEAMRQYRLAIASDPDLHQARYPLAVLLISQRQTAEAIHQLQEVLRIKPDHTAAAATLKELTDAPR